MQQLTSALFPAGSLAVSVKSHRHTGSKRSAYSVGGVSPTVSGALPGGKKAKSVGLSLV